LEGFTSFITSGLSAGNAVVVLATEAHRLGLIQRLQTQGFDLDAIIKCKSYISIDAQEALASFMVDDQPDAKQFENTVSNLVKTGSKAPNGATRRVCACGECAPLLRTQGNSDAALRVEELWDVASHQYGLMTLCGYLSGNLQGQKDQRIFQKICSLHSIVTEYNPSTQLV
jgi:DcmR-like sensory protein